MSKRATPPTLNTDYATARPILLTGGSGLHLVLVGCGGTGSWLAPTLARLAAVLHGAGRPTHLTFIDPDHVEAGNVPRQNFCAAEIGAAKAGALALRYTRAWGVDITAIQAPLDQAQLTPYYSKELLIFCGAVDNAAARRSLAAALQIRNRPAAYPGGEQTPAWWLDCGNAADTGQVLFGNTLDPAQLQHAFTLETVCRALPAPSLQCPTLLADAPEEQAGATLSCTELMLRNAQSLMINQAVATAAGALLQRLLIAGDLRIFATYLDLATGVQKSDYTTPQAVGRFAKKRPAKNAD
ncbi:MAG: ThiF family adenylyltransferase [Chloroflexota bacterium]|nr:ThiF family adenylyltransferase [Chloroflexota bacterium]